jgi:hypothetical protein
VSVLDITLPALKMAGGQISWTIICTNGTDMQSVSGIVVYSAVNKGGTYTTDVETPANTSADDTVTPKWSKSASAGTITTVWSVLNGTNKVTIQVTSTSSLSSLTKYLLYATLTNNSEQSLSPF